MPYFEFQCENCGHKFELRISNAEKSKVKCPECGNSKIKQLLTPFFSPGTRINSVADSAAPSCCRGCAQEGKCGF